MPSIRRSKSAKGRVPLADEIAATGPLRTKSAKRKSLSGENDEEDFVDTKASRKILKISKDLIDEDTQASTKPTSATAHAFEPRVDYEEDEFSGGDEDAEEWGDVDEELVEEVVCQISLKCMFAAQG